MVKNTERLNYKRNYVYGNQGKNLEGIKRAKSFDF